MNCYIDMTAKTDLIDSPEKVRGYSTDLKHDLCKIYRFIDKFKDKKTNIGFTETGVYIASMHTSMFTATERYCEKFIANLDNIKMLVEEEPFALIKVKRSATMSNGETYKYEETETFRGYVYGRFDSFISRLKKSNHYSSHKVIEQRNI